jgi:hypothetical protein
MAFNWTDSKSRMDCHMPPIAGSPTPGMHDAVGQYAGGAGDRDRVRQGGFLLHAGHQATAFNSTHNLAV